MLKTELVSVLVARTGPSSSVFQDELYAYLLLERVGERKFDQLVKLYQPKQCSLTDYQEVTQSFSAAYGLNTARFASHEETLQAVSDSFQESELGA